MHELLHARPGHSQNFAVRIYLKAVTVSCEEWVQHLAKLCSAFLLVELFPMHAAISEAVQRPIGRLAHMIVQKLY